MQPEYGVPQRPRSSFPPWALCIIIPCGCAIPGIAILAAILFPVFSQAREAARQVSCLSNVKQQTLALQMYSQDYDDILPSGKTWMSELLPYTKDEQLFHCPSVSAQGPTAFGYAFNSELSRKNARKISSPQTTVMTFDSSNLTKDASDAVRSLPNPPRHRNRGNNIGYADGHAKSTASGLPSNGP